jgi:hypothetical protein
MMMCKCGSAMLALLPLAYGKYAMKKGRFKEGRDEPRSERPETQMQKEYLWSGRALSVCMFCAALLFACLLNFSFNPEDGGCIFLQNTHVVYQTTQCHIQEECNLQL